MRRRVTYENFLTSYIHLDRMNYFDNIKVKEQENLNLINSTEINKISGHWSESEQKLFCEGVFLYGNDWKAIEKLVSTRSSIQVRSHAQKYFLKLKRDVDSSHHLKERTFSLILQKFIDDNFPERKMKKDVKAKALTMIYNFTKSSILDKKVLNYSKNFVFFEIQKSRRKESLDSLITKNVNVNSYGENESNLNFSEKSNDNLLMGEVDKKKTSLSNSIIIYKELLTEKDVSPVSSTSVQSSNFNMRIKELQQEKSPIDVLCKENDIFKTDFEENHFITFNINNCTYEFDGYYENEYEKLEY